MVERVVPNALAEKERPCRRIHAPLAIDFPLSSEKPIHLAAQFEIVKKVLSGCESECAD
jgi:hypothetical protein